MDVIAQILIARATALRKGATWLLERESTRELGEMQLRLAEKMEKAANDFPGAPSSVTTPADGGE